MYVCAMIFIIGQYKESIVSVYTREDYLSDRVTGMKEVWK